MTSLYAVETLPQPTIPMRISRDAACPRRAEAAVVAGDAPMATSRFEVDHPSSPSTGNFTVRYRRMIPPAISSVFTEPATAASPGMEGGDPHHARRSSWWLRADLDRWAARRAVVGHPHGRGDRGCRRSGSRPCVDSPSGSARTRLGAWLRSGPRTGPPAHGRARASGAHHRREPSPDRHDNALAHARRRARRAIRLRLRRRDGGIRRHPNVDRDRHARVGLGSRPRGLRRRSAPRAPGPGMVSRNGRPSAS